MNKRAALLVLLCGQLAAVAQSSIDRLNGADDKAKEKWNAITSPPKGAARVDTLRTYQINDVEQMPEFPGGETAMYAYVAGSFHYPDTVEMNGGGGRIYVEFVVERTGAVDKVKVRRGATPALDAEAVRVVAAMPDWMPARYYGGVTVACKMVLPIHCVPK